MWWSQAPFASHFLPLLPFHHSAPAENPSPCPSWGEGPKGRREGRPCAVWYCFPEMTSVFTSWDACCLWAELGKRQAEVRQIKRKQGKGKDKRQTYREKETGVVKRYLKTEKGFSLTTKSTQFPFPPGESPKIKVSLYLLPMAWHHPQEEQWEGSCHRGQD